MIRINTQKVNSQNFAEYGRVVDMPDTIPTSQAAHYQFWADIAAYDIQGETEIGICKVFRQSLDVISGMERHLRTAEILIPIDAPFVLPLLKDGCSDNQSAAFEVGIGQAVIVNPAVWHGACIPVGRQESAYFVIFRRGTPREDVETKETEEIEIRNIS